MSYAPNCMPLIQMSASYVDKEWPSVKIWASYVYISTRFLWVLKKKSECPYIYFFHPIHNYREYWLFRIYRITVCYTSLQPFSTSPSSLSHEGQFALLPSTPLPTLLTPWENLIWLQWTVVYPLSYQIKMFGI